MRSRLLVVAAAVSLSIGCDAGDPAPGPGVKSLFDPSPSRPDFFSQPWPSDDRLITGSDGLKRLDLTGFHDPGSSIGRQYIDVIGKEPMGGFGTSSAIYFRFDGPLDPASLPQTPAASVEAHSPVFLVDVTPFSPDYKKHVPVRMQFTHYGADRGLYIGDDFLAIRPEPGFPLREQTTYVAVVTDGVRALDRGPVAPDSRYTPLPADLPLGLPPDAKVVVATRFTTGEFTSIMKDLRQAVYDQADDPQVSDFMYVGADKLKLYDHYEGTYPSPNFQEGDPPYMTSGGVLHRVDGKLTVVRTETLRFALTVPRAPMPPGGWPIVLYAHGTGGDYQTFINDNSAGHAARVLDEHGNILTRMAMIGIDQVLHGTRAPDGTDPALSFYNFGNLPAGHDNAKQGGLDNFQLLRFVKNLNLSAAPSTGSPIQFDPDRIYFLGHSQGSQTGPLFLAFEPEIKAAILSGAGANLTLALLYKMQPVDIKKVVELFINESVDEFHPMLSLVQTYMESIDPHNYAHYFFREPPPGQAPKSIFQSLGIVDQDTPVQTIEAMALALRLQPINPALQPIDDYGLIGGLPWGNAPMANNVAGGAATGVLCEYKVPLDRNGQPDYDGHFVLFQHPAAILQGNGFLGTHVETGVAKLLPYLP